MEPVICASHVSVSYGASRALEDVSFAVAPGEYLGVIGPNGGGKTTLLKAILGLVPLRAGSISVFGRSAGRGGVPVGYVPQFSQVEKTFPATVREVVLTGRLTKRKPLFHRYGAADRRAAAAAMDEVRVGGLAEKRIDSLSGGEFQKMLIARALAAGPKLLLLDEPTASVDAKSRGQIFGLLDSLNRRGMTILLVTHDVSAAFSRTGRIVCLNRTLVPCGKEEEGQRTAAALSGGRAERFGSGAPPRVLRPHDGRK